MTTKVVSIPNGDYKIIVRQGSRNPSNPEYGGNITLDVGTADRTLGRGTVTITGDLIVEGKQTTVDSETMTVVDNIIKINVDGGSSTGIIDGGSINREAGLEIDRGSNGSGNYQNAVIVFKDNPDISATGGTYYLGSDTSPHPGSFVFKTRATGDLIGIQTSHINSRGGNLYLLGKDDSGANATGYISVTGTNAYERNLLDYTDWDLIPPTGPIVVDKPDGIPNMKAIEDYLNSLLAFLELPKIIEDDTSVEVQDSNTLALSPYRPTGYTPPTDSIINFKVDGILKGQFNVDGLNVDNVRILTNTVANTDATSDLILSALNGNIKVDGYLNLVDQTTAPSSTSGVNKVYSKATLGMGKSGVFFVNTTASDELVSRRRALGFSMIF